MADPWRRAKGQSPTPKRLFTVRKNVLPDTILGLQTAPKSTATGALPRTSLREVNALSRPLNWWGGAGCSSPQELHPHSGPSGLKLRPSPSPLTPLVKAFGSAPINQYVGPAYGRAEMYAGRVACCPLVSHGEYADGTDRQTDVRHTITLRFLLNSASWY